MEIFEVFFAMIGYIIIGAIIGCAFIMFRQELLAKQSEWLDEWIYCYKTLTGNEDIGYSDINPLFIDEDYTIKVLFDLRIWTKRGICTDKKEFDRLKKFIYLNCGQCAVLIKELRKDIKEANTDKLNKNK